MVNNYIFIEINRNSRYEFLLNPRVGANFFSEGEGGCLEYSSAEPVMLSRNYCFW